ncbi:hypothetical protein [Marinobacter sp. AC-23]|uniref:hypothetical protein n=1 Tax=Marinobacter sp. AC-23 TaxID=1879031 RepID=UPI0008DD6922|nr:hypothetical protein [Marinobacter sp. AC-23]OHY81478.1 hypothetical protein BCA33_11345 [Marinobacter sp. AC-23]
MDFSGKRAKLTLTPHLLNPLALGQTISGTEAQLASVSDEELAFLAWVIITEPQSVISAPAWLSAMLAIANAGPLITISSDSSAEMNWRVVAVILISSTKQ